MEKMYMVFIIDAAGKAGLFETTKTLKGAIGKTEYLLKTWRPPYYVVELEYNVDMTVTSKVVYKEEKWGWG